MNINYSQLFRRIIIPIFLIGIIMGSNQVSALTTPLNVKVGDKLNYKVTKYTDSVIVKGTEYVTSPQFKVGENIKVTIDNIGANNSYVNVTESFGGQTQKTSSYVDSWFIIALAAYDLGYANLYGYPDAVDFGVPTISAASTTSSIIPYFATSNSSNYNDVKDAITFLLQPKNYTIIKVDNNVNNNTFHFSLDNEFSMSNKTFLGDNTSYKSTSIFKITIDESKSIITNYYFYYHDEITVLNNSKSQTFELGLEQNTSFLAGFLPIPSIWLSMISVFAIATIINKKRRIKN